MILFDPGIPHNDLPLLPPKAEIETKTILSKAIWTGRALAELKGLGNTIPNQYLLIDSIILQEAKASSEIENILTTNDDLFRALLKDSGKSDSATKEVLRYREALWRGYRIWQNSGRLSTELLINVVQTLLENDNGIRETRGIRIANAITGESVYTPPEGRDVILSKLINLEAYMNHQNGIDPLIKLAVIHYQFESIHPFQDGNGRTGRILNILFLVSQNLLAIPVLYLSKAIIDRKGEYYSLLRGVTEQGQWEPWILFMLDAVESTAKVTCDRILAIRDLMSETMEIAKRDLKSTTYSKELVESLFLQPYCRIETLVSRQICNRTTAGHYLRELEEIGILNGIRLGRGMLYLNKKLFDLLAK